MSNDQWKAEAPKTSATYAIKRARRKKLLVEQKINHEDDSPEWLSEWEIKALRIIAKYEPVGLRAKHFAQRMWPGSSMHLNTAKYTADYCGGKHLKRLVDKGILATELVDGKQMYKLNQESLNQLSYVNWEKRSG